MNSPPKNHDEFCGAVLKKAMRRHLTQGDGARSHAKLRARSVEMTRCCLRLKGMLLILSNTFQIWVRTYKKKTPNISKNNLVLWLRFWFSYIFWDGSSFQAWTNMVKNRQETTSPQSWLFWLHPKSQLGRKSVNWSHIDYHNAMIMFMNKT